VHNLFAIDHFMNKFQFTAEQISTLNGLQAEPKHSLPTPGSQVAGSERGSGLVSHGHSFARMMSLCISRMACTAQVPSGFRASVRRSPRACLLRYLVAPYAFALVLFEL
jgi:hypothetical protein